MMRLRSRIYGVHAKAPPEEAIFLYSAPMGLSSAMGGCTLTALGSWKRTSRLKVNPTLAQRVKPLLHWIPPPIPRPQFLTGRWMLGILLVFLLLQSLITWQTCLWFVEGKIGTQGKGASVKCGTYIKALHAKPVRTVDVLTVYARHLRVQGIPEDAESTYPEGHTSWFAFKPHIPRCCFLRLTAFKTHVVLIW